MKKPIIFMDLDDTVADFRGSEVFPSHQVDSVNVSEMFEPGFFLGLKPVPGALIGVRKLIRMGYDVHILTQPVAESPHSYAEKVQWLGMWFPELLSKIIMTQDKGLLGAPGRYLVDDNQEKWADKFEAGGGIFVHYRYIPGERYKREAWNSILEFFSKMTRRDIP